MTDKIDQMQEREERLTHLQIQAARLMRQGAGESRLTCEALNAFGKPCGNDIPEPRRLAIPGVRYCAECQRVREHKTRQYVR